MNFKITILNDLQPAGLEVFTHSARRAMRRAGNLPKSVLDSPVAKAEINAGRWIAKCPFCSGAELVDPADLRFFCLSCDNENAGGGWLRVEMPGENARGQIEAELLKRPKRDNQNWSPGESVAKLKRENKEHGVVG